MTDKKDLFMEDDIEQIAVIGMAGRFPGARNLDQFWWNLHNGVESIRQYTDKELIEKGVAPHLLKHPRYVKAGTVLEEMDMFDASLFGYAPKEAVMIDPQQRILLETAWEALEHASYDPERYNDPIGVFAGSNPNDYRNLLPQLDDQSDVAYSIAELIGNEADFLATRISYKLNLNGPSMTVQTGCSTSLVAVQLACISLLTYQCTMALAGGVSINLKGCNGYFFQEGTIGSRDGHCRAFDAGAGGTVLGQGAGLVVLKRLSEAVQDGDTIHAIIKGCAVNNDGAMKTGYTAPSVEGQAQVIAMAHGLSGVDPETITYVEAHGTGTSLGDPIEIAALTQAFRTGTQKKQYCAIGSVKTNIGHADAAAGIAGLLKTILMLKNQKIPATLHFSAPNPNIDFENSPFYVADRLSDWTGNGKPRRAGVSSFGIGGTNVHAIIEQAPIAAASSSSRPWQLLLLSAHTKTARDNMTANLARYIENYPDINLADAAFTLQTGRRNLNYRCIVVCRSSNEAATFLKTLDLDHVKTAYQEPAQRQAVFLFPGQGAQYVKMGWQLYQLEPVFRGSIDHCAQLLKKYLLEDIRKILYPQNDNLEQLAKELRQTRIAQPAIFMTEYALAKLWMSWGIKPSAMIGHSIGEYAAACLAGVFSLEDALTLVAARGRLMQELPGGSMLAVPLGVDDIQSYLGDEIALAAINAPCLSVVSGRSGAVKDLEQRLRQKGYHSIRLHTSHAFHSHMMDPIMETFQLKLESVRLREPSIPIVSTVTGKWIGPDEINSADYWVKNLRQTVQYSAAVSRLLNNPANVFLEVGPGQTLLTLARRQQLAAADHILLPSLRHPHKEAQDLALILKSLGSLWLAGLQPDWKGFYENECRSRIPLPSYPFERHRYWPDEKSQYPKAKLIEIKRILNLLPQKTMQKGGVAAPKNKVEKSLAAIWEKLLGIKKVGVKENYFDLGGNSLLAAGMFAQIEKIYNKKIPLATLINAPTIEQLAAIIVDDNWTASWSPLVLLKNGSATPAFFLIHAAGGNVLLYSDLVHNLNIDNPIYGLQSQGLDGERPLLTRIEDMASLYIDEIRTVQPQGPYLLGGYCMGGTVAFEMARQLNKRGEKVALLALFETYNWANLAKKRIYDRVYHHVQRIDFHIRNIFLAEKKFRFIQKKIGVAMDRRHVWIGSIASKKNSKSNRANNQSLLLHQIWEANDLAAVSYIPRPYSGRVTQFCAFKQYAGFDRPEVGWEPLATGGVNKHKLPVYPAGMLVEPFVLMLADELDECIEKAITNKSVLLTERRDSDRIPWGKTALESP